MFYRRFISVLQVFYKCVMSSYECYISVLEVFYGYVISVL